MMATKASIQFDFKKALGQADKIEQIATRVDKLAKVKYAGSLQNLASVWKGGNASGYLGKGEQLQEDMVQTARELNRIAGDIRKAAKRMYQAEMAALAAVQKDT